jgi:hypothetical protein
MSHISSQHHSFDIVLAVKYGIEEAILIHHFQHWIRFNRLRGKNIIEERAWTFQTWKDIAAHFPYLNLDRIRRLCERLVKLGILLKGNFNKRKMDKTCWYAFVDEQSYHVDELFVQNMFTKGKIADPCGKFADALPDTKTKDKENVVVPRARGNENFVEEEKKEKPLSKKVSQSTIYAQIARNKLDLPQDAISYAWEAYLSCEYEISDWWAYFTTTVNNYLNKQERKKAIAEETANGHLQKEKKCYQKSNKRRKLSCEINSEHCTKTQTYAPYEFLKVQEN